MLKGRFFLKIDNYYGFKKINQMKAENFRDLHSLLIDKTEIVETSLFEILVTIFFWKLSLSTPTILPEIISVLRVCADWIHFRLPWQPKNIW